MKKFGKFIFGVTATAAAGAGLYYAYKKFIDNSETDEEDDFEDDLDEFELDDEEAPKAPEYVSLNQASEPAKEAAPEGETPAQA